MIYRGMDRAALDAAYDNTAAAGIAKRDQYAADWSRRSDAIRRSVAGRIERRYGAADREQLEFFPCGRPGAPTLVHIHGGYWQFNDKEPYAFLAESLLPGGFNLVLVEYTLAPAARMDQIAAEIRRAVAWVIDHAAELGADPARVFVSGHSAGGHLTAVAMNEPRVSGGIAISGIFDLEPIRLSYLNEKLGLDVAEAQRNSPIHHLPARAAPLVVAVGRDELPELIRQSDEFAAAWTKSGLQGRFLSIAGRAHFAMLEELARPDGEVFAALQDLARL